MTFLLRADKNDPEDDKHENHHDDGVHALPCGLGCYEDIECGVHRDLRFCGIAFDKVVFEGIKGAVGDGFACLLHEAQVEMQIMQGKQP